MLLSPAGKMPQKTIGLASLKPGRGAAVGRSLWVTVSPTRASLSFLMPAMR